MVRKRKHTWGIQFKFIQNISSTSSIWDSCYCVQTWAGNCVRCFQVPPPRAADMSSETIAMERLAPDQCQSCSRIHSCGRADNPVTESSRVDGSSPLAQSTLRREAQVLHEVPVYTIDNGEESRSCIRKGLIGIIMILIVCILLVIILRSIFWETWKWKVKKYLCWNYSEDNHLKLKTVSN